MEKEISDLERKYKELEIQNENLDREISDLLVYCNVTEKQLTTYVSSPEYFSPTQWETMQKERKRIDDAFAIKLACIPNIAKKKKAQKERNVASHWLFVR